MPHAACVLAVNDLFTGPDGTISPQLPPVLQHLRQIMVQTGVLPERHDDLERVPAWLDHRLADKPDPDSGSC